VRRGGRQTPSEEQQQQQQQQQQQRAMADNPEVGFGATNDELWMSRLVCAVGALAGLAIIPVAITARHRVFQKRTDLASDDVVLLFENFLLLKAALDGLLCLILLAGLLVAGDSMGCKVLGFLYQFEEVCTLVLLIRIAQHPFHFLLNKEDMTHTTQYFTRSVIATLVGATVVCVPLAALSDFGRTGTLCWLKSVPTQFYAFFSLVLIMWIICLSVIFRIARVTRHRYAGRLHTVYHGNFFRRLTDGMVVHLVFMAVAVVLYSYVFRLASRAYIWKFGRESAVLSFMEMMTIAFRGPVDAIVYSPKDWLVRLIRFVRNWYRARIGRKRGASIKQKSSMALAAGPSVEPIRLTLLGKAYPLPFFTDPPVPKMEDRLLFISTYNLAECKSKALGPEALAVWIPRDRDVYVLGVQECMVYQQLGEDVLTHLGGPEKYVIYRRAIGSTNQTLGYHGLIALLVFARREEVQANRFLLHESKTSAVARGKNLGVTVAQNKGGVGLAFRYYDTTFALLACHLSSDLKGRSRLDRRNQDAWRLTYETNLWREEYLLDVYHQHHVCVFLGDLNYRLRRTDAGKVLEDVAEICRVERDAVCGGEREWRRKKYAALFEPRGGGVATVEEVEGKEGVKEEESSCADQLLNKEGEKEEEGNGGSENGDRDDDEEEEDADDDEEEEDADDDVLGGSSSSLHGVQGLVQQVKSYLSEPSNIEISKLTMKRLTSSYLREIADGGEGTEEEKDEEEDKASAKHGDLQPRKTLSRRQTWGGQIFSSLQQQVNSSRQVGLGKRTSSSKDTDRDLEAGSMPRGLPSSFFSSSSLPQGALTPTNQQPSAGAAAAAAEGGGWGTPPAPVLRSRKSTSSQSRVVSSQHATTWAELLQDDELKQGMDKGDLFYGFREGEIRFPPSYRRVKGPHGECEDYTDANILKKAFSTAVREKSLPLQRLNRGLTRFAQSQQQQSQQQQQQQSQIYSTIYSTSSVPSFGSSLAESHRVDSSLRSLEVEGGSGGGSGGGGGDVPSMTTRTTTMMTTTTPNTSAGASSSARTTTRIPSYTDRILLHVVEDFEDRVSLGPYEMCDALLGSDHKPVSTVVTARVNVGVRGLNAFQQANEYLLDPTVVQGRDIVTVHDAGLYLLDLTNVRVELFAGGLTDGCKVVEVEVEEGGSGRGMGKVGKGKPPRDKASVFVLFPLDNEDAFSTLRRPAIVAAVAKQIVFLTSRIEHNPFNFFSLASYGAAKQNGVTIVSCARMDYGGLHAIFSLRDGKRGQLGACVISITGKDGKVQREQKDAVWPLTVGGCLCGHLFASLKITQLALDASTVQV